MAGGAGEGGDLVAFGHALADYLSLPLGAALTRIMATLDAETASAFSASRDDSIDRLATLVLDGARRRR